MKNEIIIEGLRTEYYASLMIYQSAQIAYNSVREKYFATRIELEKLMSAYVSAGVTRDAALEQLKVSREKYAAANKNKTEEK